MSETAVLAESALDLAWSLWAELGVSSWTRRHQDWSIEVEPLMAYTAVIAPHDPRLAREASTGARPMRSSCPFTNSATW